MKAFRFSMFACLVLLGTVFMPLAAQTPSPSEPVEVVIVSTQFGEVVIYPYQKTARHRENFLKLAREGFYNGTTFHRVIKQFMIQGGDPNSRDTIPGNDGQGGQPYTLPAEIFPEYVHRRGAVAAARLGDQMNPKMESSGCQFYIVQGKPLTEAELAQVAANANNNYMNHFARNVYPTLPEGQWVGQLNQESLRTLPPDSIQKLNARYQQGVMDAIAARGGNFAYTDAQKQAYLSVGGTPFLDMGYTVFGEVLRGMEVVDKVTEQPTATADRPVQDIKMTVRVERLTWSELQSRYGTPTVR